MLDIDGLFYGRKADEKALVDFGFSFADGVYTYAENIVDGQFTLTVEICGGKVRAAVIDRETESPYYLFKVESAEGAFVGAVRAEYERVINAISDKCFSRIEPFREGVTNAVIKYATEKYGTPIEFPWNDENAVIRRGDNAKWYVLIMVVKRSKVGLDGDGAIEIIDLRAPSEEIAKLIDGVNYLPAYHMNKKNWLTIPLDGRVSAERVCAFVDVSYGLAKGKK